PPLHSPPFLRLSLPDALPICDLLFARGLYNPKARFPAVPGSDGAGEIVSVGEGVTRWKTGDRVCPIFMQGWLDGERSADQARTADRKSTRLNSSHQIISYAVF